MTIVKENLKEFQNVNFDRLRKTGTLSSWQRQLYNFITVRLASSILDRMMKNINTFVEKRVPDGTDKEEIKSTIEEALLDYLKSTM